LDGLFRCHVHQFILPLRLPNGNCDDSRPIELVITMPAGTTLDPRFQWRVANGGYGLKDVGLLPTVQDQPHVAVRRSRGAPDGRTPRRARRVEHDVAVLRCQRLAGIAQLIYRDSRSSGVIGLVFLSHWALDFIVNPGLPLLFKGSPTVEPGLWCSGPGFILSIVLDVGLLAGGIAIYRVTRKQGAVLKLVWQKRGVRS
jgi:hypothetical protein